nr:MAG TPA: hypothetical protein [Caudoviricetes sp.]
MTSSADITMFNLRARSGVILIISLECEDSSLAIQSD